jgi:Sulfotransferase domain
MLPNFLVIGAPRAGTTWINAHLRMHPDVFMASTKEVHFFDRQYEKGLGHYETYFSSYGGQPAVGESTPAYLHGEWTQNDIPALIHRHLPKVRLIASLRNPVDRAYSRYLNATAKQKGDAPISFEEKLQRNPEFIREGFYHDQIQQYLTYFSRTQMLLLLFDDLESNAAAFMRTICEFLEIRPEYPEKVLSVNINAAAGKQNLAKSRALWLLTKSLSDLGFRAAGDRVRRLNSVSIPPMSRETREELIDVYREPNFRLQELLGRDLSHWNRV